MAVANVPSWDDTEEIPEEPPSFEGTEDVAATEAEPPVKQIAVGQEAADKAMQDELESRNWFEKLSAGLGTALKMPVLRMKQMGITAPTMPRAMLNPGGGLSKKDQQEVRDQRAIATTGPGMAGNILGNVMMAGPVAGRVLSPTATAALPTAARVAAKVALPAAGGAGATLATQPTLPGESETEQALLGAAGGAGAAGAAGALPYVVRGAKALLSPLASQSAKVSREAVERLVKAMQSDGLDPAETLRRAAQLAQETGKPVTLADVIGEDIAATNTRKLFEESLRTAEGPTRARLLREVEERASGQRGRILDDLSKNLGTSKVPRSEAFEELARTKADEAGPLYDKAFANKQPILDEKLTQLWERPAMAAALKEVIKDAANKGQPVHTIPWGLDTPPPKALLSGKEFKDGVPEVYAPTIEMLDSVKRKLYDIEQSAFKTSEVSGKPVPTESSRSIADARRKLTQLLDKDLAPAEYQQARKLWGDYSEMEQSFKQGTSIFKNDPAVIAKIVKEASPAERDAFASGIYAHINEMTSKEGLDWAGNNLLRDTRRMAQLKAAFGQGEEAEKSFKQFEKALRAESAAMRSLRTYPPTGRSMHAAGTSAGEIAGRIGDVAQGGALSTLMAMLRRASGRGMSKKGAEEIAKIGFSPLPRVPQTSKRSFQALSRAQPAGLPELEMGQTPLAVGPLEALRNRQQGEE